MCLLRNLSYQVHREIPNAERYQEAPLAPANNAGPHAASCFGAKKGKGLLGGSSMEGGGMKTYLLQWSLGVIWGLCAPTLASLGRRLNCSFLWRRSGPCLPWLRELLLGLPKTFDTS